MVSAEALELVVGAAHGEAFVQGTLRDPARGGGHHPQRRQHATGDKPAEADGDRGHDGEGDGGLDEELVQVRLSVPRRPSKGCDLDFDAGASGVASIRE